MYDSKHDQRMISHMISAIKSRDHYMIVMEWALNQIRMRHAQELLVQTRMPVAEISRAVGYRDTRGFYKMFTKHFGITCTEMRSRFSGVERDGGGGTGEE